MFICYTGKVNIKISQLSFTISNLKNIIFFKQFLRHFCIYSFFLNPILKSAFRSLKWGFFILILKLDRAERHDLKSRFLLFNLLFFFPLFLGGKRKGEKNNHFVILSHAFLLDLNSIIK